MWTRSQEHFSLVSALPVTSCKAKSSPHVLTSTYDKKGAGPGTTNTKMSKRSLTKNKSLGQHESWASQYKKRLNHLGLSPSSRIQFLKDFSKVLQFCSSCR